MCRGKLIVYAAVLRCYRLLLHIKYNCTRTNHLIIMCVPLYNCANINYNIDWCIANQPDESFYIIYRVHLHLLDLASTNFPRLRLKRAKSEPFSKSWIPCPAFNGNRPERQFCIAATTIDDIL